MKIYITILLSLLLIYQINALKPQQNINLQYNTGSLPYQAHGFNNLDIARHLLLKGVKYFKFDASLANKQSCIKNSNWNYTNPCLNNTQYTQQICCIAMRGDLSSQPNFNYPFNTSGQFVALIDQFLSQYHKSIEILFIAIDFQFQFAYTNKIAQKFLYDLAGLMYKYPKVHITAKGDYILEFDKVCRFHAFMNQNDQACTPERNYISKSRFFLQSGSYNPVDSRDYKGRFQNFNVIFKEIDNLCRNGFPTWMNKYTKFPLIFWQPSNQRQIQTSIRKLMDPACQAKHNRTLSGIAFATNTEPEMFEVMMKQTVHSSTGSLWKFQQQKLFFENTTGIKMAKLVGNNSEEQLALYKKTQTNNTTKHFLYVLAKESQNQISIKKFIEVQREITELYAIKNTIVAVMKNANNLNTKEYSATLTAFSKDLEIASTLNIQGYLTGYSSGDMLYYISLTSNPQVFNTYMVNETLKKPIQYKVSVFMQRQRIDTLTSMLFQKGAKADQDIMLIFGNNVNKTWVAQIRNSQEHKVKDLVFGTNAKIIGQSDSTFTLIVQNSYSHGGLLINNNAQNTCIYHKIDDLKPLATVPHLLNLLQGNVKDLISYINDGSSDIITACNHDFIFTKIMNGGQSELVQIWDYLIISTKFIPINKLDFLTTLFTGGSNFQPQLRNKTGFLLSSLSTKIGLGQKINEKIVVEQ